MKLAILADIHGNLEALRACLEHARRRGAERYAFLGDLVGYGADPVACLELLAGEVGKGALCVRGNHDEAALGGLLADMHSVAREAAYWTRARLGEAERGFLRGLPLMARQGDLLFVHASADAPQAWTYITGTRQAARCMAASGAAVSFAGHVHHQTLYFSVGEQAHAFVPTPGVAIPLTGRRRWLALVGSVGQPRDGSSAAAYALFDDAAPALSFFRVPYDHMTAAQKIIAAGLPERLARRLQRGE